MATTLNQIDRQDLQRRIEHAVTKIDEADFLYRQVFDELLGRLSPMRIAPETILNLGAGSGRSSGELAKNYRRSRIISLDISDGMLRVARKNKRLFSKQAELRADAALLPLRNQTMDFVFANLLLPWVDNVPACFEETARVLKKGGLFAFATLGPDSFKELREAWSSIDTGVHVRTFPDMHDVGDALLGSGLAEPIVDVDYLQVTYHDMRGLFQDLTACGARNSLRARQRSLTGKGRFSALEQSLKGHTEGDKLSITLELVYGHAWGTGPRAEPGEFHFDPGAIEVRRRQ